MNNSKSNGFRITFDSKAKAKVLELLDKGVDKDGYIVEKSNPSQRVLNVEFEEVCLDEFAGIRVGSEIIIKNDLHSLMKLSKL